jgi:cytochrome c peroxidase
MRKETILALALSAILIGCSENDDDIELLFKIEDITTVEEGSKEELGRKLYFDKNLSLTRNTSCATCHNPEHGFIDNRFLEDEVDQDLFIYGALSVGDDNVSLGGRNSPTVSYAMFSPEFQVFNSNYVGGQFWDGRADALKDQAMGPPLDGAEMMMPDRESVVQRIQENSDYIEAFKKHYGEDIFSDVNATYEAMGEAIGKFEKSKEFAPFDSKYDRYVRGEYNLTEQEKMGMDLFYSESKTNCAECHIINDDKKIRSEMFTNYRYHNIGTPKNFTALQAKGLDYSHTDHGIYSQEKITDKDLDGAVKTPTLRNVAVTGPYMHNGVFKELRTVLEFYDHMGVGNRPINPETNQPWGEPNVKETINHSDLKDTKELTDEKIDALEAFLRMLTDKRYEHLLK